MYVALSVIVATSFATVPKEQACLKRPKVTRQAQRIIFFVRKHNSAS